ncbi:MAG: hypothetical protein RBU27_06595 [Bacteroidota bacterium]|nr:hypothetical protein [Bacteroidota bacterium]
MHITTALDTHIDTLVSAAGARLVEVVSRPVGRRRMLEVFVDTEEGITAEHLAALSRSIGDAVDANGWITETYQLIVSSPGLDRPLRFAWQYRRHLGRTVQLVLRDGEQTREVEGPILAADAGEVLIGQGEESMPVPLDRIISARVVAVL